MFFSKYYQYLDDIDVRKELNDMKKDPIKKGITFNWDIAEELDK